MVRTAAWATRYEALRSHTLQATTAGGHEGLIVLLRQGVAAWMRARSLSIQRASTAGRAPRAKVLRFPDEMNASFVQVIASMALAGRYQEVHA